MAQILSGATHFVSVHYATDVKPPKQAGGMAISTWHIGLSSAQTEVSAAKNRLDIDTIILGEYGSLEGQTWKRMEGKWYEI